jgi:hypothetical protein
VSELHENILERIIDITGLSLKEVKEEAMIFENADTAFDNIFIQESLDSLSEAYSLILKMANTSTAKIAEFDDNLGGTMKDYLVLEHPHVLFIFGRYVYMKNGVPKKDDNMYLCNDCNEAHEDETDTCEHCSSESIRIVSKGDLGI